MWRGEGRGIGSVEGPQVALGGVRVAWLGRARGGVAVLPGPVREVESSGEGCGLQRQGEAMVRGNTLGQRHTPSMPPYRNVKAPSSSNFECSSRAVAASWLASKWASSQSATHARAEQAESMRQARPAERRMHSMRTQQSQ